MALVAFYSQFLGTLCPSVFVLSLSFYWLFYISLNISLCLVFLSSYIKCFTWTVSFSLGNHCDTVFFCVFGRLFNCGHHHWLVVFSCGSYMHTAEKISWFNSNITKTLLNPSVWLSHMLVCRRLVWMLYSPTCVCLTLCMSVFVGKPCSSHVLSAWRVVAMAAAQHIFVRRKRRGTSDGGGRDCAKLHGCEV